MDVLIFGGLLLCALVGFAGGLAYGNYERKKSKL